MSASITLAGMASRTIPMTSSIAALTRITAVREPLAPTEKLS
jgi:hypothetical protein